jgi:formate dehydrogenase maturation protein FdhE
VGKHICRVTKNDPVREERIDMEIVVDAYDSDERAMGWFCSLEDTIENKVRCRCRKTRSMSPLKVDEEVDVLEMAPADDCESEMFVFVQWNDRKLAVPLEQLEPISGDPKAIEMIEDWLYWCLMGYEF